LNELSQSMLYIKGTPLLKVNIIATQKE